MLPGALLPVMWMVRGVDVVGNVAVGGVVVVGDVGRYPTYWNRLLQLKLIY